MFATRFVTQKNPFGEVMTHLLDGGIVEVVHRGHCGPERVRCVLEVTPEALREVPGAHWLLELSAVTSADPLAALSGGAIMRTFKARGGRRFVVVSRDSSVSTTMTAMGLANDVPVAVLPTRAAALDALNGELSRATRPPAKTSGRQELDAAHAALTEQASPLKG